MPLTAAGRKKLEEKEKEKAFSKYQSVGHGFGNVTQEGPTIKPTPSNKGAANRNSAFQLDKAPAGAAVLKPGVKQTKLSDAFNIPTAEAGEGVKASTNRTIGNLETLGERNSQKRVTRADLNAAREMGVGEKRLQKLYDKSQKQGVRADARSQIEMGDFNKIDKLKDFDADDVIGLKGRENCVGRAEMQSLLGVGKNMQGQGKDGKGFSATKLNKVLKDKNVELGRGAQDLLNRKLTELGAPIRTDITDPKDGVTPVVDTQGDTNTLASSSSKMGNTKTGMEQLEDNPLALGAATNSLLTNQVMRQNALFNPLEAASKISSSVTSPLYDIFNKMDARTRSQAQYYKDKSTAEKSKQFGDEWLNKGINNRNWQAPKTLELPVYNPGEFDQ